MLLQIAWRHLCKHKARTLVLIVQLLLFVILGTACISVLNHDFRVQKLLHYSGLTKTVLYQAKQLPAYRFDGETMAEKKKELQQIYNGEGWAFVGTCELLGGAQPLSCTVLSQQAAKQIHIPVSEGTWFHSPLPFDPTTFQAVVSTSVMEQYRLGQTYTAKIGDSRNQQRIAFQVVGILAKSNDMLTLSGTQAGDFIEADYQGIVLLPPGDEACTAPLSFFQYVQTDPLACANDDGHFKPITEILASYRQDNRQLFGVAAVFAALCAAVTISGMGASLALQHKFDKKRYSMYYFAGATIPQCVTIEILKTVFLFSAVSGVALLAYSAFYNKLATLVPLPFLAASIGAAALLYLPATLWKVRQIARINPIQTMKEDSL